jgi:hypothetical protein
VANLPRKSCVKSRKTKNHQLARGTESEGALALIKEIKMRFGKMFKLLKMLSLHLSVTHWKLIMGWEF